MNTASFLRNFYFLIISVFTYTAGTAQATVEYGNFIQEDGGIKWAAVYDSYADLTPVNPNFSILNFYMNKLKTGTAAAYIHDSTVFAVKPISITYDNFISGIRPVNYDPAKMNWRFNYDDKNNAAERIFHSEINACGTCINKNKLSFFKIKQLLYYKNYRFYIRNILINPIVYTKETGSYKEQVRFYETADFAFDDAAGGEEKIPASAKYIGRSANNLVLLPAEKGGSGVVTVKDWNLAALLRKDIIDKNISAYETQKSLYPQGSKLLRPEKIDQYLNSPIEVPIYDSLGNQIATKKIFNEINTDSIYNFTLVQDFYFDFGKEKLYSKPIALVPRINIITSSGINLGLADYWGVILREEKQKTVKKK